MTFRETFTRKYIKISYFSVLRSIFTISLAFMLSLSILGPSFIVLINKQVDIEVALELGEDENKKESKKELDQKDTFFELYTTTVIAKKSYVSFQSNHTLHLYGSHIIDVQSPPPEYNV